jgi:membrane fusion protein, multidrug efflux system
VRKAKRGLLVAAAAGAMVLAGYGIFAARSSEPKEAAREAPASPEVVIAKVEEKPSSIYLRAIGTVEPIRSVAVASRVDGEIVSMAFTEGQDVQEGDLLFLIDQRPYRAALDQAEAQHAQNVANLDNARLDLKRYEELVPRGNVSRQTYDTQLAKVRQLEAALEGDRAAIETARLNLSYTEIRAPVTGRTGAAALKEGTLIRSTAAQTLVTVTQMEPIEVTFTLPQQKLEAVRRREAKTPGDVRVVAVKPDNLATIEEGRLVFIDNRVAANTGTIQLKARFENAGRKLWPGEFVNARLEIERREAGIVADARAVQTGPRGYFAYVVRDDDTVEARPVKVAQVEGGAALIDEGLKPGERVVVQGQLKLKPDLKVRIAAPEVAQAR